VAARIGKRIGEGEEQAARDYADRITVFVFLLGACAAFVLLPLSRLLPFIFNVNTQALAHTVSMFVVLCVASPFKAVNMAMVVGICRAGGDTVFCVVYDVAIMWLASLPAAAAASFVFHAPIWLIYLCIVSEDAFKMILGLWRLKSGKWLHNVTV
jgi:Na+-driven multidrug efflux pump